MPILCVRSYFLTNRPNINLVLRQAAQSSLAGRAPCSLGESFPGATLSRGIPQSRASSRASILGIPRLPLRAGGSCFDRRFRRFLERGLGDGDGMRNLDRMAEFISRIRSASSIRRSRNISAFRIMATSTRSWGLRHMAGHHSSMTCARSLRLAPGRRLRARSEFFRHHQERRYLSVDGRVSRSSAICSRLSSRSCWDRGGCRQIH